MKKKIKFINNQQFTYVVLAKSIDHQIAYNLKRNNGNMLDGKLLYDLDLKSNSCHFLT